MDGNLGSEVTAEDVVRSIGCRTINFDFDVESTWSQNGWVNEVFAVCGSDDNDVTQTFDAINFSEQLRNDC